MILGNVVDNVVAVVVLEVSELIILKVVVVAGSSIDRYECSRIMVHLKFYILNFRTIPASVNGTACIKKTICRDRCCWVGWLSDSYIKSLQNITLA